MQESEVKDLIRALDPVRCAWEVGWRFGLLLTALLVATRGPWPLAPFAFLIIGIMQYHILVLSHEAQHVLITRGRSLNDLIGAWALAYPFGQPFFSERARHLAHHRFLGLPSDPDYYRYVLDDKRPYKAMILYFVRLATYGKVMEYIGSAFGTNEASEVSDSDEAPRDQRSVNELMTVACVQIVLLLGFTIWSSPLHYAFFWLLPLLTVTTTLSEFREYCEHAVSPRTPNVLKTFRLPRWEVFVLGPVGFEFHAEHHFYPTIPHYLLQKTSVLYPETSDKCEVHTSYLGIVPLLCEREDPV